MELLYGDHEGGQRAITRFTMLPLGTEDPGADSERGWLASQSRHWNVDRPDPRQTGGSGPRSQGIPSSAT